jgi:hypothetical protein
VRPCLERASLRATIMVISSSSHETLIKDWRDAGLLSLTSGVAEQEMGSKAVQLKNLLPERHDRSRALMEMPRRQLSRPPGFTIPGWTQPEWLIRWVGPGRWKIPG